MDLNSSAFGFFPSASIITPVPPEQIAVDLQESFSVMGGIRIGKEEIISGMPLVFLVLTGGTEKEIHDLYTERKKYFPQEPLILAAHPSNNSLPAAVETLARIKLDGGKGKIFYFDGPAGEKTFTELRKMLDLCSVYHKIASSRIGLVGNPSDWLIASSPDPESVKRTWGAGVYQIGINELIEGVTAVSEDEIEEECLNLVNNAADVVEPSPKELVDVVKVNTALKKIIARHNVTSLSVRCFDLVTDLQTTGCFALSKLNDDGIIAGCEGDMVSTVGMLWVKHLTERPVWMANPARVNPDDNTLVLAHCTVPVSMVEDYTLRSHFESGLGVGIQGSFKKENVTLVRIGGRELEKIWIAEGSIIRIGSEESLCRTQVTVKLSPGYKSEDILNEPLGNHILMVTGRHASALDEYWRLFVKN